MTRKQFNQKFQQLESKTMKMIQEFKRAALKSGSIEMKSEPDNYRLPKNVMTAALLDIAREWETPDVNAVKNITACTYPDYTRL